MEKYDVVQFTEKHKWCGCLGFINEISASKIMVGVQIPTQGIAYVFAKESDLERIGKMVLVPAETENTEVE
jgi:hypothetical protein